MTETVYVEPLTELNPKIRSQLVKLNNRWNGRMLKHLQNPSDHVRNAQVYYILVDERVVSWGMAYHTYAYVYSRKHRSFHDIKRKSKFVQADIYTKKSKRGQGFGYRIATVMREDVGRDVRACTGMSTIFNNGYISSH
jgi:hypothetical protein